MFSFFAMARIRIHHLFFSHFNMKQEACLKYDKYILCNDLATSPEFSDHASDRSLCRLPSFVRSRYYPSPKPERSGFWRFAPSTTPAAGHLPPQPTASESTPPLDSRRPMLLPTLLRRAHAPPSQPHRQLSRLLDRYGFVAPASLTPAPRESPNPDAAAAGKKRRVKKPPYRPPSSLDLGGRPPARSDLPFDFRFSYTESTPGSKPIGLREPKYSPFGPGRLDRPWTGLCAPAVDATLRDVDAEDPLPDAEKGLEEARRRERERLLGELLTPAERAFLVEKCQKNRTKRQINLGRIW